MMGAGQPTWLTLKAIDLISLLVTSSTLVAWELLHDFESNGSGIERGLRDLEGTATAAEHLAILSLALLDSADRRVFLRLLHPRHKRLACASLRHIGKFKEALQQYSLRIIKNRVLLSRDLPLRAKLTFCAATLEAVVPLYASRGCVSEAAHMHLMLVCTMLLPASAISGRRANASITCDQHDRKARASAIEGQPTSDYAVEALSVDPLNFSRDAGASDSRRACEAVLSVLLSLHPLHDSRQQHLVLTALHRVARIRRPFLSFHADRLPRRKESTMERRWLLHLVLTCRLALVTVLGADDPSTYGASRPNHTGKIADHAVEAWTFHIRCWSHTTILRSMTTTSMAGTLVDALQLGKSLLPSLSHLLLHDFVIVRYAACNALTIILKVCRDLGPNAIVGCGTQHGRPESTGARSLDAEVRRQLDASSLLNAISSSLVQGCAGVIQRPLHVWYTQVLETLRGCAVTHPGGPAAEPIPHVMRSLRGAEMISPFTKCQISQSWFDCATNSTYRGTQRSGHASCGTCGEVGSTTSFSRRALVASKLRLTISAQPRRLRSHVWRDLSHEILQGEVLHLSGKEVHVWLRAVKSNADSQALVALLNASTKAVHRLSDYGYELDDARVPCSTSSTPLRLSPLCLYALEYWSKAALGERPTVQRMQILRYVCRVLRMLAASSMQRAGLIHARIGRFQATQHKPKRAVCPLGTSPCTSMAKCAPPAGIAVGAHLLHRFLWVCLPPSFSGCLPPSPGSSVWRHLRPVASSESSALSSPLAADASARLAFNWHRVLNMRPRPDAFPATTSALGACGVRSRLNALDPACLEHVDGKRLHAMLPLFDVWTHSILNDDDPCRNLAGQQTKAKSCLQSLLKACCNGFIRGQKLSGRGRSVRCASQARMLQKSVLCAPDDAWVLMHIHANGGTMARSVDGATAPTYMPTSQVADSLLCTVVPSSTDVALVHSTVFIVGASLHKLLATNGVQRGDPHAEFVVMPFASILCNLLKRLRLGCAAVSMPESVLYRCRDLMQSARTSSCITVASELLHAGTSSAMRAFLPALSRQFISESSPLRQLSEPVRGHVLLLNASRRSLLFWSDIATHCPISIKAQQVCILLQSSSCSPTPIRKLIHAFLAARLVDGMPLVGFSTAQALDFASHTLSIAGDGRRIARTFQGEGSTPSNHHDFVKLELQESMLLKWLKDEDVSALKDSFPVALLVPSLPLEVRRKRARYDVGGADPLGVLLTLHSLLRSALIDIRIWLERGAVAICIAALAASSPIVRQIAYDCLGIVMHVLDGAAFAERRQIWHILLSLKDTTTETILQFPGAAARLAAQSIAVLQNPLHPQYLFVNAFLSRQLQLSLDDSPLLLHTLNVGTRMRTSGRWLLEALAASLGLAASDADLLRKMHAALIVSLYHSPATDAATRCACSTLLATTTRSCRDVLFGTGIASWIGTA